MQKKFIWFNVKQIKDLDELKQIYRDLAKHFHPDTVTGDQRKTEQYNQNMKEINVEYDDLKQNSYLLTGKEQNDTNNQTFDQNIELSEELQEILNKIKHLEEISIEVCGSWIWVNSPKQYKEYLKYLGFSWHSKKLLWYYKPKDQKWRKSKKQADMENIRLKYGSQEIQSEKLNKIA